jgi:hypothetical protein
MRRMRKLEKNVRERRKKLILRQMGNSIKIRKMQIKFKVETDVVEMFILLIFCE